MKIVHVSGSDLFGGASRSAYRLHHGLRRAGCDSQMYVNHKGGTDPTVSRYQPSSALFRRAARTLRRLQLARALQKYDRTSPPDRTFFTEDRTFFSHEACRQIPPSDLLNLHWVSGFLDYGAFFAWRPPTLPIVWTFHDMTAFTGGCCYDLGCGKFVHQCGACPQLGSSDSADLSRQVWLRKKKYFAAVDPRHFHIVTPSRWMGEEVRRSSLLSQFPCSVIPYGLDLDVFQPQDRRAARTALQIPPDARVLLFVSHDISTARKGFRFLADALQSLPQIPDLFLLSLGLGFPPQMEHLPHLHIPSITEDAQLSLVYSAADLFVAPSLADNLPNTILESIACGTPVVAFNTGGMPDAVRPGQTGLLASVGDTRDLQTAILELLTNDSKRKELAARCRQVALSEYSLATQAHRYLELYSSLLHRNQ